MKFLPWLFLIGVCAFAYYGQQQLKRASEQVQTAQAQFEEAKQELEAARRDAGLAQEQLKKNAEKLTEFENTKKELTSLKVAMKDSARQLSAAQGGAEEGKKQAAEFDVIRQKLMDTEGQVVSTKDELAAAQAQLSEARAEIQQLKAAAQARPPIGTAMDRKR
jgi:chromosome segregation ATPase